MLLVICYMTLTGAVCWFLGFRQGQKDREWERMIAAWDNAKCIRCAAMKQS
jgi:hypothetical protein